MTGLAWVLAAIAAWLMPAVLVLCMFMLIAVRDRRSDLVNALRRRQATDNVGEGGRQPSQRDRLRSRNVNGHA